MGNGEWGMGNWKWEMGNWKWEIDFFCFLISLPKAIFVIARLVGPFSEKLWPRSWKCCLCGLWQHFSSLRSRFFTSRTDSEPFLSALNWLTSGFVYATLSFNRLTLRPQNRFISNYFMLVAFSSTVKFSKIVLPMWNFVQSLKYFVISTKLIAVSRCESPEIRLFLLQIEYQIAMIKEENSTEIIFT